MLQQKTIFTIAVSYTHLDVYKRQASVFMTLVADYTIMRDAQVITAVNYLREHTKKSKIKLN